MAGNIAVMRDISLIWLIFLTLLAVLPWGVLFFFMIKGMTKVRWAVKTYAPVAQGKLRQVADVTGQVSVKITQPVVAVRATGAQVDAMTRTVFRRNHT